MQVRRYNLLQCVANDTFDNIQQEWQSEPNN